MDNTLYVSLSGQMALRRKLDSIANNMANISTTGYKVENTHFDSYYKKLETDGKGIGFVYDITGTTDFSQGAMQETGNDLDIAISGNGMLSVVSEEGNRYYTRDGRMSRNLQGELVMTTTGHKLLDNSGSPITVPPEVNNIAIANDGTLSANGQSLGRIGLFNFQSHTLERLDNGIYRSEAEPEPATGSVIIQGFLEGSNVNAVKTLTEMIQVQRAYEAGKNLMDSEDQRIRTAISRLGDMPR